MTRTVNDREPPLNAGEQTPATGDDGAPQGTLGASLGSLAGRLRETGVAAADRMRGLDLGERAARLREKVASVDLKRYAPAVDVEQVKARLRDAQARLPSAKLPEGLAKRLPAWPREPEPITPEVDEATREAELAAKRQAAQLANARRAERMRAAARQSADVVKETGIGWWGVAATLVAAAFVHLVVAFSIPLATGGAYGLLAARLPPNAMVVLPAQTASEQALPFLSPDFRYAMCRYDVAAGPVAISATLMDAGSSLAIYTPEGDNYYVVPGQDGRRTDVQFVISATADRLLSLKPGARRADVDATLVTSPKRMGLVVVRAARPGIAFDAGVETVLKGATCQAVSG
jgi:uncharacterized membrane protein